MRWLFLLLLFGRVHSWEMEQISQKPRVFIVHDFLSHEECDYLIQYSEPHLERSMVVNPKTGRVERNPARISYNMFCPPDHGDPIIASIEKRIEETTAIPWSHSERMNFVYYSVGGEFKPHYDYFDPKTSQEISTAKMAEKDCVVTSI